MIRYLAVILVCQLISETIQVVRGVPVPGPVLGMAILFAGLIIKGSLPNGMAGAAGGLLRYLGITRLRQ